MPPVTARGSARPPFGSGSSPLVFFAYSVPRKERVEPERLERLHGAEYVRYRVAVRSLLPSMRPCDRPSGRWRWAGFLASEEPNMVVALTVCFVLTALHAGVV